jgi:hypothetical protein
MKIRKNRKYTEYLIRFQEREEELDSLLYFWMGVDSVKAATDRIEKFNELAKEVYTLVDEMSSADDDNCSDLYSVADLSELARRALGHLNVMQEMIPEWQQSSDFKFKQRKKV